MIGGPCLLIGLAIGMLAAPFPPRAVAAFLVASSILVAVGLLDDRFDLRPSVRLVAQAGASMLFVIASGLRVEALGPIFGPEPLMLGGVSSGLFTVLASVAAVNAFNMLDGIDGLAATLGLIALGTMVTLSYETQAATTLLGVTGIGVITAFLVSNLPATRHRLRCFLGDSGSTLVGFLVAVLGILTSQGRGAAAAPVTVLWLVALPIYDVAWAIVRRLMRGQSPLQADEDHLHHALLRAGFTARGTFAVLIGLAVALAVVGITLENVGAAESHAFALFGIAGIVVVWALRSAGTLRRLVASSRLASVRQLRRFRGDSART